jgi:hypothetical protein
MLSGPREPIDVRPVGATITYRLRRPTSPDRSRFEREFRLAGGREWTLADLLAALDQAVDELVPDDDEAGREALHNLIRERIEAIRSVVTRARSGELPSWGDEFRDLWREVTDLPAVVIAFGEEASRRPTRYAEMLADLAAVPIARGVAAARTILEAVIDDDGRTQRVSPAVIDAIPTHHLIEIGAAAYDALYLSQDDLKNSPSRSRSSNADRSSTPSSMGSP